MSPKIISVKEQRALDPGGAVRAVLNVTYTIGTYGPFTLLTTWTDLQSGAAMQTMQQAAATLNMLPTADAS
jgi:hypothetical protein